jgi:hypothetical protein
MQCILYKIYFWKVFHMYYNLICILYALLCGQNFILVKSGCYTTAPWPVSPQLLGSLELPTLSQKVPLLVIPLAVRRARTPGVVARSEVPADRRVDGRCSCVLCDGYEPSII